MLQDNKENDRQLDHNINDLGRRPDGSRQEQQGTHDVKPIKEDTVEGNKTTRNPMFGTRPR